MGCLVEVTDTGVEVDVHVFNDWESANIYITKSRGYKADWQPHFRALPGFDFYTGPVLGERCSLRKVGTTWRAAFWIVGDVKVETASPVSGKPAWHGLYRVGGVWHPVSNGAGNAIAYASPKAASDGAQHCLTEVNRNTVR